MRFDMNDMFSNVFYFFLVKSKQTADISERK